MDRFDIFAVAKQVSIVDVISHYLGPLKKRCGRYYALCPFHNDHKIGSFVVFQNGFKCFACGTGGDAITFVQEYLGVSAVDAAIKVAEIGGCITLSEAAELRESKRCAVIECRPKHVVERMPLLVATKKDAAHCDKVYRCFAGAALPLDSQYRSLLLNKRRIQEKNLEKYFICPKKSERQWFWSRFRACLCQEFGTFDASEQDKLLIGVPGFFLNKKKQVTFLLPRQHSLGILIRNRQGLVSGIQMRSVPDESSAEGGKEDKQSRYKFLSSGFADGSTDSYGSYGCCCGYVEDVLYPEKWNHSIAITEGRFKAEILAKIGFMVVNLHSISNWKPAAEVALDLAKKYNSKRFVLCYDSEKAIPVFNSAHNLLSLLGDEFPVEFAIWDPAYGKGIDDVINNGRINEVRRVTPEEYFSLEEKVS